MKNNAINTYDIYVENEQLTSFSSLCIKCHGNVVVFGLSNTILPILLSMYGCEVYCFEAEENEYKYKNIINDLNLPVIYFNNSDSIGWPLNPDVLIFTSNFKSIFGKLIDAVLPKENLNTLSFIAEISPDSTWKIVQNNLLHKAPLFFLGDFLNKTESRTVNIQQQKVSIIIPTFNRSQYIAECLESVLSQTYENLEIIIIDDGSTDNTLEVIRPYLIDVKYLRKTNGGKASAINLGIKHATGRYLWILDDDDIGLPRKLSSQVSYLEKNPEIDALFSIDLRFIEKDGEKFICNRLYPQRINKDETVLRFLEDCIFFGQTALFKKDRLVSLGPFREDLLRSQDHEMWIRVARFLNIAFLNIPTTLIRNHDEERGTSKVKFDPKLHDITGLSFGRIFFKDIYDGLQYKELVPEESKFDSKKHYRFRGYFEKGMLASLYIYPNLVKKEYHNALDIIKVKPMNIEKESFVRIKLLINIRNKGIYTNELNFILNANLQLILKLNNKIEILKYLSKLCYWESRSKFKKKELIDCNKWLTYCFKYFFYYLISRSMFRKISKE